MTRHQLAACRDRPSFEGPILADAAADGRNDKESAVGSAKLNGSKASTSAVTSQGISLRASKRPALLRCVRAEPRIVTDGRSNLDILGERHGNDPALPALPGRPILVRLAGCGSEPSGGPAKWSIPRIAAPFRYCQIFDSLGLVESVGGDGRSSSSPPHIL